MKISSRVALLRINKNRCKPPDSARMASTLASESAEGEERSEEIPDEIPFNQEQHEEFWSLTWEAFMWYCINILNRPEVVVGVTAGVLLEIMKLK